MPRGTRYSERHKGIRRVHAISVEESTTTTSLKKYIREHGITQFLADAVRGDMQIDRATLIPRREVIFQLDRCASFRRYVSNLWRQEDPHTHEWIPCTYISDIASRAIQNSDFRYILLADAMRSPTQSIIFKPRVRDEHMVYTRDLFRNRMSRIVLQAHPGGLRYTEDPTGTIAYYTRYQDNAPLIGYSPEFHNDIIRALGQSFTLDQIIQALGDVHKQYSWDGKLPANGYPLTSLWHCYTRGDGTPIDSTNFMHFTKAIQKEYKTIRGDFERNWPTLVNHSRAIPPDRW